MLPQLSLFQQCSIQSQDLMQTWLHWRHQDALLVQKHFVALFHPKPNECLRFDLESCNLHTLLLPTHACHIPPLAQARPVMLCIYTSTVRTVLSMLYATNVRTVSIRYFTNPLKTGDIYAHAQTVASPLGGGAWERG